MEDLFAPSSPPPPPQPLRPSAAGGSVGAGGRIRDPGGPAGRMVAWTAIIGLVALLAIAPMLARPAPAPGEGTPDGETDAEVAGAVPPPGIFGDALKPIALREDPAKAEQEIGFASGMFMRGTPDEIRLAIVAGDALGPQEALERLGEIDQEELPAPFVEDIETLTRLYEAESPEAVGSAEAQRLVDRYDWFGRLALTLGASDESAERSELLESARGVQQIVQLFNIAIFAALVVGVGLFIAMIAMLLSGNLRRAYAPPAPGGSAYVETFAAFLIVFLVVSIIAELLTPTIGAWSHMVRWLILPAAAWPLVRGAPWRNAKYALGWHRGTGWGREAALGIVGYIACLPIIGVGLLCTLGVLALWTVLTGGGEEGAVPTHPIGEMLAGASTIDIALLVMLGVVWAPVVEETFFRGALYHHLRGGLGAIASGLITGLLFAAIHPQGLFAIPALMSIGFVLSLLREWRGTIIAPMAAHAMNNGFIFAMLILVSMA